MRINEITKENKPYLKITRGKKHIEVPFNPKNLVLPANKRVPGYSYIGSEDIRVQHRGKRVRLNWGLCHANVSLFCTYHGQAYKWDNIKVARTYIDSKRKKETLVLTKQIYGTKVERRRYRRYPIAEITEVVQGTFVTKARTHDISYGGIGIILPASTPLNAKNQIKITFDKSTTPLYFKLVRRISVSNSNDLFGFKVLVKSKNDLGRILDLHRQAFVNISKDINPFNKDDTYEDKGWTQKTINKWH